MGLSTTLTVTILLAFSAIGRTSPLLRRDPQFLNCNDDQTTALKTALDQVGGLAGYVLSYDGDKQLTDNKGYKHYFTDSDKAKVLDAYTALVDPTSISFNLRCATEDECEPGSFAFTDPTEESFQGHGHTKGVRVINICPMFFTDPKTTRTMPNFSDEDKDKREAYCKNKETKKLADFETAGHTLLHEISHLDSFGVKANYPEETNTKGFEYKYHGTVDWNNKSGAGNARTLKTSKSKNKPHTWQNAESLAAAAMEMYAMDPKMCDIKEIDV